MRIKSIELRNFRSYKDQKIEFGHNINILVGANNSGKSSLIKAVYKLQNNNAWGATDVRKGSLGANTLIVLDDINDKECGLLNGVKPEASILFTQSNSANEISNTINSSSQLSIPVTKEFDDSHSMYLKMSGIECFKLNTLTDKANQGNFIYPFLSKRKTEYFDSSIHHERSFDVTENLRNIAPFIQRIGNASHRHHELFNNYCKEILGFTIGIVPAKESSGGTGIGIYAADNEMINVQSMGDGVINIIGLIAFLLSDDRKLYLIEELENDIHPEALKKLLNLIIEKSAYNQFIISTHSNIVLKYLGSLADSRIFYFNWSRNDENAEPPLDLVPTTSVSLVNNSQTEKLSILQKLGYDLFDFELYKGYLILEESSAETIIRDFLIPQFFPELSNSLKTIAAGGTGELEPRLIDFLRLFVFVHTSRIYEHRAWVIADGDPSGMKVIEGIKSKFNSWPERHFLNFSCENFEEYYPEQFKSNLAAILSLKGEDKRNAKRDLLLKVIDWLNSDKERAKGEFQKSAKEVLGILQNISDQLNNANIKSV